MMGFTIFSCLFVDKIKNKVVSSDPESCSESRHDMNVLYNVHYSGNHRVGRVLSFFSCRRNFINSKKVHTAWNFSILQHEHLWKGKWKKRNPCIRKRIQNYVLKVVGNEKWGGSGVCLLIEKGTGPWWWMSVYFLMGPLSFLQRISVSCWLSSINRWLAWK